MDVTLNMTVIDAKVMLPRIPKAHCLQILSALKKGVFIIGLHWRSAKI